MTHTELVKRAVRWLRNSFHCRVILAELKAQTAWGEIPDAIGWVHNIAILVECKANKADFHADLKKPVRKSLDALGSWRFYLTPKDLIKPDEIIKGWGLYEVQGRKIVWRAGREYYNVGGLPFESDRDSEVAMLVSALSRVEGVA